MADDFDHPEATWNIVGGMQRHEQINQLNKLTGEIERQRSLPDCPHCGHKLPKKGVDLCGTCRREVAWVQGVVCKNTRTAIAELTRKLEAAEQARRENERLQREVTKAQRKLNLEEDANRWSYALSWGALYGVVMFSLFGFGIFYANVYPEGSTGSNVGVGMVVMSLLWAFVGWIPLVLLQPKKSTYDDVAKNFKKGPKKQRTPTASVRGQAGTPGHSRGANTKWFTCPKCGSRMKAKNKTRHENRCDANQQTQSRTEPKNIVNDDGSFYFSD